MGYCTQADIEADFKGIDFKASGTAVTVTELENIIAQESAYIDGRVGAKYVTPVTDSYAEAFLILKRICIFRVSDRVRNIIQVKTGQAQKDSAEKAVENSARLYNKDLSDIAKGLLVLKDVPLLNTSGGFDSYNEDCGVEPVFKTTKQQW